MKTQKGYQDKSYECPACNSDNVEASDDFDMDEENAYFPSECKACGLKWNDVYKFKKYSIISESEEK